MDTNHLCTLVKSAKQKETQKKEPQISHFTPQKKKKLRVFFLFVFFQDCVAARFIISRADTDLFTWRREQQRNLEACWLEDQKPGL